MEALTAPVEMVAGDGFTLCESKMHGLWKTMHVEQEQWLQNNDKQWAYKKLSRDRDRESVEMTGHLTPLSWI